MTLAQTKREKLNEREGAILSAARARFIIHGMDQTKLIDIARDVGIAEGTLYLYFKNKNALARAVVRQHWGDIEIGARRLIDDMPYTDFTARLQHLAEYHLKALVKDWALIELSFQIHYAVGFEDFEDQNFKKSYGEVFDVLFAHAKASGEIHDHAVDWIIRDMFFGGMEYMARNLHQFTKDEDAAFAQIPAIAKHVARNCVMGIGTAPVTHDQSDLSHIISRLEQAIIDLKK